ncbi:methylated-DNA--[protein]-cysteine S-methyltransferase [Peribacillus kribbensis]|uniref:methylated-DNA--[protein]-cysteine S-methyltransferase n=1 Tax=Peribacillus kribbensis TaxID=356658 RepID=UPI000401BA31|nr:methylated-DNA--[protein]-cysteine S-methyltransferase [Peribacillus kribbensis]
MFLHKYNARDFGSLYITADEEALTGIYLDEEEMLQALQNQEAVWEPHPILMELSRMLDSYFSGEDISFELPLKITGTPFQKQVWEYMKTIPYGETRSYSDTAAAVGSPKAVRAVGQASRRNPFPIVVPCHRIIGKNGALTGYSGSKTNLKEILLGLESRQ